MGGHGTVFVAKQRYDAIGKRQSRILAFDRGEELEVTNPVPGSEWWEATSLRTGKQGEVPSSYLARRPEDMHMEHLRLGWIISGRGQLLCLYSAVRRRE